MMQKIKLGDEIKDIVANIQGIAIGYTEYLDGSKCWIIQPKSEGVELAREVICQVNYCVKISDGVEIKSEKRMGFIANE